MQGTVSPRIRARPGREGGREGVGTGREGGREGGRGGEKGGGGVEGVVGCEGRGTGREGGGREGGGGGGRGGGGGGGEKGGCGIEGVVGCERRGTGQEGASTGCRIAQLPPTICWSTVCKHHDWVGKATHWRSTGLCAPCSLRLKLWQIGRQRADCWHWHLYREGRRDGQRREERDRES